MEKALRYIGIVIAVAGLILLILYGYQFEWTGFGASTTLKSGQPETTPSKKLWDWLELLVIPILLAIGGFLFNRIEKRREKFLANQQTKLQMQLDNERFQESSLQSYYDFVSKGIFEFQFVSPDEANSNQALKEKRNKISLMVRSRTLSLLPNMNPNRKRMIFQFLLELRMIVGAGGLVHLHGADLSKTDFSNMSMEGVDLGRTILRNSTFNNTYLKRASLVSADLTGATFINCDLQRAIFTNAQLNNSTFLDVDCRGSSFVQARFNNSSIKNVDWSPHEEKISRDRLEQFVTIIDYADFSYCKMENVKLNKAFMPDCKFVGAQLINVDTTDAIRTLPK